MGGVCVGLGLLRFFENFSAVLFIVSMRNI